MHESEAELDRLQGLLDRSHAAAGAHLRSILQPTRRLSAARLCQELRGVCILHLATVSRDGAPLVAPVDGLFFRGRFHFCSPATSVRFRHIAKSPKVSGAYTRGEELSVLVSGVATPVDTQDPAQDAFRAYNLEVYGDSWESWGYWNTYPYASIEPERMVAAWVGPEPPS